MEKAQLDRLELLELRTAQAEVRQMELEIMLLQQRYAGRNAEKQALLAGLRGKYELTDNHTIDLITGDISLKS